MLSEEEEQRANEEPVIDIINDNLTTNDSNLPPPRTKHWIHWELVGQNTNSLSFKTALLSLIHSTIGMWGDVMPKDVLVVRMTEAFSNVVLKVQLLSPNDNQPHAFVVKIHGFTDVALKELKWLRVLSGVNAPGHAPALLAEFGNGHIEECIDATSLTVSEMRNLEIAKKVMQAMSTLHKMYKVVGGDNDLYNRVERWRVKAEKVGLQEFERIVSIEFCKKLVDRCKEVSSPLVMSHNDLQMGNIMLNKESGQITFVDYEYSGIAPRGYDIANYLLEWMADYSDVKNRESMNLEKYPNEQERRELLASYLQCAPQDPQVVQLEEEIKPFTPLSHLLWTLWAIHQSSCSEIDFDYLAYARTRYAHLDAF